MNKLKPVSEVAKTSSFVGLIEDVRIEKTIELDRQHTKEVLIEGLRGMKQTFDAKVFVKGFREKWGDEFDDSLEEMTDQARKEITSYNLGIDQAIALVEQTYKSNE